MVYIFSLFSFFFFSVCVCVCVCEVTWHKLLLGEGPLVLLGCYFPHGCQRVAQLLLLPLDTDVCAHPLLDELECPLVLGHLEQPRVVLLIRYEAAHLTGHVSPELDVLDEEAMALAMPRFAGVLRHLVVLVKAQGHGVVHGYYSPMAARTGPPPPSALLGCLSCLPIIPFQHSAPI